MTGINGGDALTTGFARGALLSVADKVIDDLDIGEIGGLPRIMDMGQCNDAYSAIKVGFAARIEHPCGEIRLDPYFHTGGRP